MCMCVCVCKRTVLVACEAHESALAIVAVVADLSTHPTRTAQATLCVCVYVCVCVSVCVGVCICTGVCMRVCV
jgi:hypothetical protein